MSTIVSYEADVLSRLEASLTPEGARDILKVEFSPQDKQRMLELLDKGNRGVRTPAENQEAMEIERVGHVLSMLKSIARRAVNRNHP